MKNITTASLFFLAAGIFTSVSILSAFQILFTIPLIYLTYIAWKEKSFKDLPTSAWFLVAFFFWGCFTVLLNLDVVPTPSKNLGRLQFFLYGSLGIFVLHYWLLRASDKTKAFLMNTFFLSIAVSSSVAIYKVATLGGRSGGFLHYMRYGYGLALVLIILGSSLLHKNKVPQWFNQKYALIAIVFSIIGLALSQTRGAALGLFCAVPFILFFYKTKWGRISAILAMLAVGALGAFYFFGSKTDDSSNRYLMSKNNASDNIRRNLWMSAVHASIEKPIAGWGYSNGHTQVKRISERENYEMMHMSDAHAHNLFLDVLAGTGIVGLLIFLSWLFFWAKEVFLAGGLTRAIIFPLGVALVISSQFEVTINANLASFIFIIYAFSSLKTYEK